MANAIKSVAKIVRRDPASEEAVTLRALCEALEQGEPFQLQSLFTMKGKAFDLALELIEEWRFDRHVASRRLQKYLDKDED
jgi:hypothetical protein